MSTSTTVPAINLPKKPRPCPVLPKIPPITIPTPFGVDIKSMVDSSNGPPTNCAVVHSLMLQLTPMLAGFTCILKMLNVMASLEKFAKSPLTEAGDLIGALGKASSCLGLINPLPWIGMIKGILQMILSYIGCLIEGIESIEHFKAGIDLNAEGGTPLLLSTLSCASNNGDTSMAALMQSMEPIQPLLQMMELISDVIGLPLGLPTLNASASSGGSDPLQPIIEFHDKLQEVVDALPS